MSDADAQGLLLVQNY